MTIPLYLPKHVDDDEDGNCICPRIKYRIECYPCEYPACEARYIETEWLELVQKKLDKLNEVNTQWAEHGLKCKQTPLPAILLEKIDNGTSMEEL